ncbi:hypothetical protein BCR34DRAFT_488715 [Clohesyomyces aquaticus]|uniref:Uncharacterized protein n=1 Tax=Clohesyomyces aquaticus TaxID=1231657 RepID=A0A1Y1ZDX1_9PLEO|nr:hypothetical protein BCR34DRAFT_488715 [Clohesyomyces aquaticus]
MWWDDAIARNMNLSQGYTKVAVLLIKWLDQLDEGGTRKQLVELEVLFRERFRFLTKTVELSISTKPQHQLDRYLSAFIDQHDGSDTLLIVCYTGYSIYHEDHEYLELTGKFRGSTGTALNDGARANWSKTEAVLRSDEIEGDVLVLLNTPYGSKLASTAERSVWRDSTRSKKDRAKKFEVLSACAIGSPKALPREGMFTQILTSALNEATAELHNASFTTFQLNQRMLLRPGTSNPQSVLWANLSHDQGYIRIAPLKVEKDRQGTRTPRPPRGYLTLRFALRNATLSEERIEYLAQALTRATSDKALVGVRRIDWLRFQPARSTLLDQAGLAKFAIARWKFFVKRRQQKRDSKTKTGEI